MNGELAFGFIVRFIQRAVGNCFLEVADASALCVSGAAVISVFTHVKQHELQFGKIASGTPLFLWSWDTELGW